MGSILPAENIFIVPDIQYVYLLHHKLIGI